MAPSSLETSKALMKILVETVDSEYSRQSSTPTPPRWSTIKKLVSQFKKYQNITITGQDQQRTFIEILLKYVDLVMTFLSDLTDSDYRKQINYSVSCLTFIPVIFKQTEFCNLFVQIATGAMIELLTYGRFNMISKRALLTLHNLITAQSQKQVRVEVSKNITYLMYQLVDGLATYGDYVIQSDIMELLFRVFGTQILTNENLAYDLFPESQELGQALKTDISIQNFDAGVRKWLNKFNENSSLIFTLACTKVIFGSRQCLPPEEMETTWVDFNMIEDERMLGFFLQGSTPDSWNRITILAKDVKQVEIKRPSRGSETVLSVRMTKSCISEQIELQDYYNKMEKHLQLFMENKDKDKITKLISTVLPQVFGDAFSHTSSKPGMKQKNVYKPLAIKISKRKSSVSDISTATSMSRSKSDVQSVELLNSSRNVPVRDPSPPLYIDSEKAVKGGQFSKVQEATSLKDTSIKSVTDFTKLSCRSDPILDHVSIASSDNLDVDSSRFTSSMKSDSYGQEAEPKVQDNIVTSSHGEAASSKIEILSGRCSGRSADHSMRTHDTTGYHLSEVFSSSPIKISQSKNPQDVSSGFSEGSGEFDVRTFQKKNVPKSSATLTEDSTLDEEYETAHVDLDSEFTIEEKKVSCSRNFVEDHDNLKKSKSDRARKAGKIKVDNMRAIPMTRARIEKEEKGNDRIEELQMKDSSDMETAEETPISIQGNPDKHMDKLAVDINDAPVLATNEKGTQEIDTGSTTSNLITHVVKETNEMKNVPSNVLVDNEEVSITLIKNNEFFTEDMFEGETERYKPIVNSQEVEPSQNSEDVFSRPTQAVSTRDDQDVEQFTDLSLAVNVGISDNQFSESAQYPENEVSKAIVGRNKLDVEIEENMDHLITNDVGIVDNKVIAIGSKQIEGENIIDLTFIHDDNDKKEGEVKKKTKPKTNDNKKENVGKRTLIPKNKPVSNTPELLGVQDDVGPMDKALKETEKKNTDDATVNNVPRVVGKKNFKKIMPLIVKQNCTLKEFIVIKENPKTTTKKPRTLIKTGTKRFELNNEDTINPIQDDMHGNKELCEQGEEIRNAEPEALSSKDVCVSSKEANDTDDISKKKDNIQETGGVTLITSDRVSEKGLINVLPTLPSVSNEKNLKVLLSKMPMPNNDESLNSSPEVQSVPPKILSEDVASQDIFDKLKESQEKLLLTTNQKEAESAVIEVLGVRKRRLLQFPGKKELAIELTQMNDENDEETTSNSESELAPIINMENIDYLETFDRLKMLEENKSSDLIQKKTEPGILKKCTNIIRPVEAKDISSHSEEVPTESDNKIVDKIAEDEDDDKVLASFILKKPAKHLLGIPKCTNPIKPVETKDVSFHSEKVVPTEHDNKVVGIGVATVDKMAEDEDEDDDRVLASFILKKPARNLLGMPKCTNTIKHVETKDVNLHSEKVVPAEDDNKIVDSDVATIDKMAEDEDEDDDRVLASFVLKKPARRLLESQETATDNENKPSTITRQNETNNGKVSSLVNKGTKKGKKKQQIKQKNRQVVITSNQQIYQEPKLKALKEVDNKNNKEMSNKKELRSNLDAAISIKNNMEGLEKFNSSAEPNESPVKETVDNPDNKNRKEKKDSKDSFTLDDYDLELSPAPTKQKVATKTPDSSPEVHQPVRITAVAEIHRPADCNTLLTPDKEGSISPVKKSKRLAEKRQRSSESLQEFERQIEQELNIKKGGRKKRKSEDLDEIVVVKSPKTKRTRSNDKIERQLPDDFDQLLNEEISLNKSFNYSQTNTTIGNRSRKLFNQGNYSYLDNLPGITEDKSPDLDETPIPLIKGTKVPKRKKGQKKEIQKTTKTNTAVGQKKAKTEKSPKDKTPKNKSPKEKIPTASSKRRTTPQLKKGKLKGFRFTETRMVSLSELFNQTCRSIESTSFRGLNHLQLPMDIVARSAPQYSSSDDNEPPVDIKELHNKHASPELPKNIEASTSPSTPAYSFPDFEIEPFYKKAEPPQKKINILHDVVIKPKRPLQELVDENNKRRKIDEEKENIPIPTLPEDDDQIEKDVVETHQRLEEVLSNEDATLAGMMAIIKYMFTLFARRHQPDFHIKLNTFIQETKEKFKI